MNFLSASLTELARGGRLFVGAVTAGTRTTNRDLLKEAYAFMKVSPANISEAMPATPWVSGRNWKTDWLGFPADSVVVNTSRQVFACIYAPPAPSTSEPVTVTAVEIETADGYVWRHLYTVSDALHDKYSWADKVPVAPMPDSFLTFWEPLADEDLRMESSTRLTTYPDYGAVLTPRVVNGYLVGASAVYGKVEANSRAYVKVETGANVGSGAILKPKFEAGVMTAEVVNQGSGYTDRATGWVIGNGTGAQISLVVSGGKIVAATIVGGSGYTWADILVTDGDESTLLMPVNFDYDQDLDRRFTLLSKTVKKLDEAATEALDLHFFLAETAEPMPVVRGQKGSRIIGPDTKTRFSFLSALKPASFKLSQEMLINTVITSGSTP